MIKATQFIEFEVGTELPYAGKILAHVTSSSSRTVINQVRAYRNITPTLCKLFIYIKLV